MVAIAGLWTLATLLTGLVCWNSRSVGTATGLIDRPDGVRKLHPADTPVIGGVAVMLPIFAISVIYYSYIEFEPLIVVAVAASSSILIVGALDDLWGLAAYLRLLALTLAVLLAFYLEPLFVLHAFRFKTLGFDFAFDPFAVPVSLLIVVGFVNASNMADGLNGQLLGSVVIWCAFIIGYIDAEMSYPFITLMASSTIALLFNLRGQLFSGSAGAYSASLFVGLGAIAVYRRSGGMTNAEIPVYWFWLPVGDCLRLIVWRVKDGRSPLSPDRHHFHHILLKFLKPYSALAVYLALLAAPGVAALLSDSLGAPVLLLCLLFYLSLVIWDGWRTKGLSEIQS